MMTLSYLTDKFEAPASEELAKGGTGDSVSGTQLGFNLEVKRLWKHFAFKFRCKVEHVHDDVNFSFSFLPKNNYDVNHDIPSES